MSGLSTAAPLSQEQSSITSKAARLLDEGRPDEARAAIAPMIAQGCHHPEPLMIYSVACEQLGHINDAMAACNAALKASPDVPELWASLGRLLYENGRAVEGLPLLEHAIALDPRNANNWYNLGLGFHACGNLERSEEALIKSTQLNPEWPSAWGSLGFVQEQRGSLESAESSLRRALSLNSASAFAQHALTVTLRRLGKHDEALSVSSDGKAPETRLVRAHILADVGSEGAPGAYQTLLAEYPALLDGHETYAHLMPQLGRTAEALDTYRSALRQAPTEELYLSALASARDIGDADALVEWSKAARRLFGDRPEYSAFEGLARLQRCELEAALAIFEPLASRGFNDVLGHCADARLRLGDFDSAERWALAATRIDSTDQAAWSYLSLIWRLKNDPRELWLADYERLVMPIMLDAPDGFGDIDEFMKQVAGELHSLHRTINHPAEQSLRQGTQTRGRLFEERSPLIRALAQQIRVQVDESLTALPADSTHPFLGRNVGHAEFKGSWSVRLRSGGFHVGHIHHQGWLSSALYVELPAGMGETDPGSSTPGALVFGVPSQQFNVDLAPRRIEQPIVGRLVIFPSYFWHGTVSFESESPRLTVAFDMLPSDTPN